MLTSNNTIILFYKLFVLICCSLNIIINKHVHPIQLKLAYIYHPNQSRLVLPDLIIMFYFFYYRIILYSLFYWWHILAVTILIMSIHNNIDSVRSKDEVFAQELKTVIVIINNYIVCLRRLCGKKNLIKSYRNVVEQRWKNTVSNVGAIYLCMIIKCLYSHII